MDIVDDFSFHRYVNTPRPYLEQKEKINSNFYFHTSLMCFKRFYEGL